MTIPPFQVRYTVAQAAQALGCSERKVEQLIAAKKLKCHTDEGSHFRYISVTQLLQYIETREEFEVLPRFNQRSKSN